MPKDIKITFIQSDLLLNPFLPYPHGPGELEACLISSIRCSFTTSACYFDVPFVCCPSVSSNERRGAGDSIHARDGTYS